jgi:hypothetical protein
VEFLAEIPRAKRVICGGTIPTPGADDEYVGALLAGA